MRISRSASLLAMVACSACSSEAPEPKPPVTPTPSATAPLPQLAAPPPPALRLPHGVTPVREAVDLTLKPSETSFEGSIDFDLRIDAPTSFFWLDASRMEVHEAALSTTAGDLPARVVKGGESFVGFAFDREVPAGPARLHAKYTGKILDNDDRGIFREKEDDKNYLFSQFENTEARSAFPCFDEPSYKHPWKLTIHVPKGQDVVSNTPVQSKKDEGELTTVEFVETKPLPAYLVAFAVGPLSFVDAGKTKSGTPVRIVVPTGRESEADYAAKNTAAILDALEGYFGIRYPYEKMDVVPVPHLVSFSAMENAGMITIGMGYTLARKGEDHLAFQRNYVDIMAHELAHQWFGDLVTTAWWDDIWLNEGFATWMGNKTVQRLHPEWRFDLSRLRDANGAMGQDSLVNARKIRQEIKTDDDIENAFDGITYEKGATVLGMFERFAGDAKFQAGIKRYLDAHAFGVATSADFLADVSAGSGVDMVSAFSTFLDQPGVPLVKADLDCKIKDAPKLDLSQERYLPIGSKGSRDERWQIPVCVSFGDGAAKGSFCARLDAASASIPIPAKKCPQWVMPNSQGLGYYHVAYSSKDIGALLGKKSPLNANERLSVAFDLGAMVGAGKLPIGDALARVADLAADPEVRVADAGEDIAAHAREVFLEGGERERFAKLVEKAFGARARALGLRPRPNDAPEDQLQRANLVGWFVDRTDDPELVKSAKDLAAKWLDDPKTLEPVAVPLVLNTAAAHSGRDLFQRMLDEAKKAKDDHRRGLILNAISSFRDPAIVVDAMRLVLANDFDVREVVYTLFGGDFRTDDARYQFVKENYDALVARMPAELKAELVSVAANFCDASHRADVDAFFRDRSSKVTGGPRRFAQVLESIDLCIAQRAALRPSLAAFLKK